MIHHQPPHLARSRRPLSLSLLLLGPLAGCASMAALGPPLLSFARNLLDAVTANYAPDYAAQVEELLEAMNRPYSAPYIGPQEASTDASGEVLGDTAGSSPSTPLMLDVSMLRLVESEDGRQAPTPMEDGAILYDGNGDLSRGDRFKVTARASEDCHLYVIGIDATGWVTPVFPSVESSLINPVPAGTQLTIPEGRRWFHLDGYRGVETLYFMASRAPRPDLEELLARFSSLSRPLLHNPVPVTEPAVTQRGFVAAEVPSTAAVEDESGTPHDVDTAAFLSEVEGMDVVVTRWFEHRAGEQP